MASEQFISFAILFLCEDIYVVIINYLILVYLLSIVYANIFHETSLQQIHYWLHVAVVFGYVKFSFRPYFFLFYGLQIRRLYFKQIEIKIKSYFLGFFIAADEPKQKKMALFNFIRH